ncbi:hypothetical protein JCM6882_003492 [Rhodosporidiobolus microsporus]
MVLLQLTPALQDRLSALAPQLPVELRELVAAHLAEGEGESASTPVEQLVVGEEAAQPSEKSVTKGMAAEARTITHEVLLEVSRWARKEDGLEGADDYRLASLLRLTDVHAPPLLPREKSPELLAILADIQLQQDRMAYASLTSLSAPPHPSLIPTNDLHDPARNGGKAKTVAEEWKEIRREVGAIVNVGASMMAVGTAVWWVGGGYSYATRLGLAMSGAIAIAAIEAFLYYRFFTRNERETQEAAKRKARAANRGRGRAIAAPAVRAGASGGEKKNKGE